MTVTLRVGRRGLGRASLREIQVPQPAILAEKGGHSSGYGLQRYVLNTISPNSCFWSSLIMTGILPFGQKQPTGVKVIALSDPAIQKTARLAELIADSFYGDGLDMSARDEATAGTWFEMPEVGAVRRLRDLQASDREVRLFLTFVSAVDRMRDASRLWRAAATLYESRPDLFEPTEVARVPVSKLREVLSSAEVSRFHKPDSEAWKRIAVSLVEENGPTRQVIKEGKGDAREVAGRLTEQTSRKGLLPSAQRTEDSSDVGAAYGRSGRSSHKPHGDHPGGG